jgi:hypothetical protein
MMDGCCPSYPSRDKVSRESDQVSRGWNLWNSVWTRLARTSLSSFDGRSFDWSVGL